MVKVKGHIRKRSATSWAIVVDLPREKKEKRKQKWITVHGNKRQATQSLKRILRSIHTGTPLDPQRATVGELLAYWLENHAKYNIAASTYQRYREICYRHWQPEIGNIRLNELQGWMISDYYQKALLNGKIRSVGGLSPATLRHHHVILNQALTQAMQWGLIEYNPLTGINLPAKSKHKKVSQAIEYSTAKNLLNKLQDHNQPMYLATLLALTTGLRRGELLGLKWRDYDRTKQILNVQRSCEYIGQTVRLKVPKTQNSERVIFLPKFTYKTLNSLATGQNKDHPIITNDGVNHWNPSNFSYVWAKALKEVNFPKIRFHDLRHSHASQLLGSGINPQVVAQRLGHASVRTTLDIYAHVLPEMQIQAIQQINSIYHN